MHFLSFLVLLYFAPALVAMLRRSHHAGLIFLLNLCTGWTGLGWVAAVLWALLSRPRFVSMYPTAQGYRRY